MELINMVNENKALHDEMNDVYKKSGNTSDENQKFLNKYFKLLILFKNIYYFYILIRHLKKIYKKDRKIR